MAYLDNSGDILLDAVLTDTGRKLLAEGKFQISKYAFGDDEINYALYDLDHPSGSSYADLEILQTPVFEAFTEGPALKYGLMSNRNLNLYYLPDMLFNNGEWGTTTVTKKNNVVYVAVNSQTATSLKEDSTWNSDDYNLLSGRRAGGKMITIESGIDNADVLMTSANLENYIVSTHLLDLNATVSYDNNFISSIMSAPASVNYKTNADGEIDGSPPTLVTRTSVIPGDRPGFRTTKIDMSKAGVFIASGAGARDAATLVQSLGVVGSMTSLNVTVPPELQTTKDGPSDSRWTKFGQTGVVPTGFGATGATSGFTFSTIDTSIEITGTRSGASLNIPLTLIRRDA